MSDDEFKSRLKDRLFAEFDCTQQEAKQVVKKANQMREVAEKTDSGYLEDFEVTVDLVVDKVHTAPDHFPLTTKWNWWAGSIRYIGDSDKWDFKI